MHPLWLALLFALRMQGWTIAEIRAGEFSAWRLTPPEPVNGSPYRSAVVVLREPKSEIEVLMVADVLRRGGFIWDPDHEERRE
jgi:hypothetical protein